MIIKEVPEGKGRFEFVAGLINESRKNNKDFKKQRVRDAAAYRRTLRSIGQKLDNPRKSGVYEFDYMGLKVSCPVAYSVVEGVDYFGGGE